MLYKNFKYLCDLLGKTQKAVLKDLSLSEGSPWQWKKRKSANLNAVKRIGEYFSEHLKLPPEMFRGKALIEKDFELLLKNHAPERILRYKISEPEESPKVAESKSTYQELTDYESEIPYQIREIINGNRNIPLPHSSVNRVIELLKLIGIDTNRHLKLVDLIKTWGVPENDTNTERGNGTI